jgi:CheY-like chemotaxis protein
LLLDLHMPVMDGFETTREILKRWERQRPRIVALTASALDGDRQGCLDAGMDDYLSKPFRREALGEILSRVPIRAVQGDAIDSRPPEP